MKTDDQVPTAIPTSSAIAKSVSVSPPSSASAVSTKTAPSPVFTVRGTVCRHAVVARSATDRPRR